MATFVQKAIAQLSRLSLSHNLACRGFKTQSGPLAFRATLPVCGEPLKKKKRVDLNLTIQKEQKKKKKLEKAMKKLEQRGRTLKPIEEIEGTPSLDKTTEKRRRQSAVLTFEESERRALLHKEWSRYKIKQHSQEMAKLSMAMQSQEKALTELRNESEELYQLAIQIDDGLIPIEIHGPVNTPPVKNYMGPDGDYVDTTKKYDKV